MLTGSGLIEGLTVIKRAVSQVASETGHNKMQALTTNNIKDEIRNGSQEKGKRE